MILSALAPSHSVGLDGSVTLSAEVWERLNRILLILEGAVADGDLEPALVAEIYSLRPYTRPRIDLSLVSCRTPSCAALIRPGSECFSCGAES